MQPVVVQLKNKTDQDYHVHPSLDEKVQSEFVVLPGTDCSATQQLFAGVFGSQRVISVLLQVSSGNNGNQLIVVINNGEFS